MRRIALALATLTSFATAAVPAVAARGAAPVTVVVAATVADDQRRAMPPDVWQKLVADWVNASKIVAAPGSELPAPEACKASGALYAVAARFTGAPRIMGAGDPDRRRALVHASVLDCLSGKVDERTIAIESEPLSRASAGDYEPEVERTWTRPAREALARSPFQFAALLRVTKVTGSQVEIANPTADVQDGSVLRVFADDRLRPYQAAEIVIVSVGQRYAVGTWIPNGSLPAPHVGDYVRLRTAPTAEPSATSSPATRR